MINVKVVVDSQGSKFSYHDLKLVDSRKMAANGIIVKVLRIYFCAHRSLFERDSGGRGRGALSLIVKLLHADNHALIRNKLLAIITSCDDSTGGEGGDSVRGATLSHNNCRYVFSITHALLLGRGATLSHNNCRYVFSITHALLLGRFPDSPSIKTR